MARPATFAKIASLTVAALLGAAEVAVAQEATLGVKVRDALSDLFGPLVFITNLGALILGVYLMIKGVLRLVEASGEGGRSEGVGGAALGLIAGALLIALPQAAGVGMMTFYSTTSFGGSDIASAAVTLDQDLGSRSASLSNSILAGVDIQPVENCLAAERATPCMARNIAKNVVPVGIVAVYAAAFLVGLWGFVQGIQKLAQPRGPGEKLPEGWAVKMALSVVLMNVGLLFTYVGRTLFGEVEFTAGQAGLEGGSGLLRYTTGISDVLAPYEEMMGSIFVILALYGVYVFVKGVYIMRDATEARSQHSMGKGLVYLVFGMCLANMKYVGCVTLTTAGFQAFGSMGFCS